MLFALGVAKIIGVMALSCYVAVLWVRTAHAIAQGHTENIPRHNEGKRRLLEDMYRAKERISETPKTASVAFFEVANAQHNNLAEHPLFMSMESNKKSDHLSITFNSDSTFAAESNCASAAKDTVQMNWELYGDNVINFVGKKKHKEAVL